MFVLYRQNCTHSIRATRAAPDGLVPEPFHLVDQIFDRMNDALEFDPFETVWALIAHTAGAANDVDPTIPRTPFDSTPTLFDGQLFIDTQLRGILFPGKTGIQGTVQSPLKGEMRLQSDHLIARDSRTACGWKSFATDQAKLQDRFQFVLETFAMVGQDPSKMIDCSEVNPIPKSLTPAQLVGHLPAGKIHTDIEQASTLR